MRQAGWFDLALLFLGLRRRFRVEGDSMLPTLRSGVIVLVKSGKNVSAGDVVLATHPYKNSNIVKRIAAISLDGKVSLIGDNPSESTDSRAFGEVSLDCLIGKVECVVERNV